MTMNRRDFIKFTSAGITVAGAAAIMTETVSASVPNQAAWNTFWRPEIPTRLCATTRELALRALSGEHGRTMGNADFSLPDDELANITQDMRYALAAKLVAEKAPLRILPFERIVGAATLKEAPLHATPVAGIPSVSHTTLGFDRVLHHGVGDLRKRIQARLDQGNIYKPETPSRLVDGFHKKAVATDPSGALNWSATPLSQYAQPPLTVECLVRLEKQAGYNIIIAHKHKSSPFHWELFSEAGSGKFSAYLPGYTPDTFVSDYVVADGEWHQVALVFEKENLALYVDGAQVLASAIAPGASPVSPDGKGADTGLLHLGAYAPGNMGCHGQLEAVHLRAGAFAPVTGGSRYVADDTTVALWKAQDIDGETVFADLSPKENHAYAPRSGGDLLDAMLVCLDALDIWRERHIALLEERIAASSGEEQAIHTAARDALRHVPENPPRSFQEAVQSLWFLYAFQRLMGNWSGIGRIDEMLWPYLKQDLDSNAITLDEAREILAHFWIKGCEWIGAVHSFGVVGSGDAQHYQNIVLAGIDRDGNEVCNPVTYLVMDIVEELHISDFPVAVRVNRNTPKPLLRRIAEVQRHGGGIVAIYNEDVVIDGLVKFGYPLEEARCFANDGCWETLIPGKTLFSYMPFDGLSLLHDALGLHQPDAASPDFAAFDDLYAAFVERLSKQIYHHNAVADNWARNGHATPLVSMFIEGCIESTRSYYDRGPKYAVLAPHIGGIANVANSLLVLKKLVYEDRYITLPEFVAILRNDWDGQEHLRRLIHKRFTFYGNDDDEADAMLCRVFNDYTGLVAQVKEREGVRRPAGISTFGREIEWAAPRGPRKASPDGHHLGEVLATNCSPSPGTDGKGPTAVINSYCKLDFTRCPNGATLELKVQPDTVRGEAGVEALVALMRGFVRQGGMFLHIDVVDSAMLIDAQRNPEKYPNLAVRVAGWSARFATLDKNWQDMVIARTQQYTKA